MKKIFIAMMAMAAFAACATEDTIVTPQGQAIAFGDAFVDNATKAIYENGAVPTEFKVWGNVAGKVADGEEQNFVALYGQDGANVEGSGVNQVYTCDVVRYWTPSCDFNFAAIVNGTAAEIENGLPTKVSYTLNANDPADLLYASATATTDAQGTPSGAGTTIITGETTPVVAFTFNHLLSKMYFDVTSSLDSAYAIEVKSISVTGFDNKGVYTISPAEGEANWAVATGSEKTTLTFANGASGAQLIIPVAQALNVTVTYDVKFGVGEGEKEVISANATKTGTIASTTYNANTVYKISAAIGLNEIKFTTTAVSGFGTSEQGGSVTIQ